MCSTKFQRTVTLRSTEAEYVVILACAQYLKFVSILLGEITEVQKLSVMYEDNQGAVFLSNNVQVGMRNKHVDIRHHFMR